MGVQSRWMSERRAGASASSGMSSTPAEVGFRVMILQGLRAMVVLRSLVQRRHLGCMVKKLELTG